MRLKVEIALFCIIIAVWIQHVLCDADSTKSESNKWTCTCSIAARQENSNFIPANCSSSCDCSPAVRGSRENRWMCICPNGGLPRLAGEDNGTSCFTACNCNAGTLSESEPSKKRISSEVVAIVLFLCLVLMALAFVASVLWFVYQKDKHLIQWASPPSDRLTSSCTNLMSRGSSSLPVYYKEYFDSSVKPYIGCIPGTRFLFRSRGGAIQGTIIHFSYSELESATNKFSDVNLIGFGGSSHVYRGNLRDGRTVAIKRMKTQAGPDAEHVFLTEIELISRLHHCHMVPLLGYCSANHGKHAERLLVFEYIPNGNLRECLDDGDLGECLDWNTRVSIALGAARGLEYLHEAAAPRILHRDVKSTNILLDDKWKAKITDLGMAKHLHNDGIVSCSSSPARMQGTFGYFAPEYAIVGRASLKSDVFSFGVVLLELITGRKPIYKSSNKGEESLVIWATPRLHDSESVILELPDPRLKGAFQEEEMQVMAYLAKECLLLDPDSRPSMTEVVQILSTISTDKSKRTNFPIHAFQYSSAGGTESVEQETTCDGELIYAPATEEIKQITFETPACCSSLTNPGSNNICMTKNEKEADDNYSNDIEKLKLLTGSNNIRMTKNEKEADDNYSNDIEKLKLLTSKSRSCHLRDDDEVVDITEPRLESFCLPNVGSHIVEIA